MVTVYFDRVKETTTTTGTGTVTLAGAATGFRTFTSVLANGTVVTYCIEDGTNWEVGQGTFTTAGTSLSRSTVIASSNANALVSFSAGTKNVFLTLSARDVAVTSGVIYGQSGTAGTQASTYDRATMSNNVFTLTLTGGTIKLAAIQLPVGLSITNIAFNSGTTAGATLTHQWFCLTDKNLKVLAVTADATNAAWTASSRKSLAVASGPFLTTYAGLHYVGIMVTATTVPTLEGAPATGAAAAGARGLAPLVYGDSSSSGQTTPIVVGTTISSILSPQAGLPYVELN